MKKTLYFRRASCLKHFKDDKSFFQEPKEIGNLINKENLIHKYLPKQTPIGKMLEVIQRKILKGTHLPVKIKDIQAGYLHILYFKGIYLYLSQNKLPSSKTAIKRVETLAENYILLDSLLFKINLEKKTAVLAVPEACIGKIITLYHANLFADIKVSLKHIWPLVIHSLFPI